MFVRLTIRRNINFAIVICEWTARNGTGKIGKKLYKVSRTGSSEWERKGKLMKNYKFLVIMFVAIMCLSLVSIPKVFSQQLNTYVQVVSYSHYVNSAGDFIVVGEVQNDGNSTLQAVTVNATALDSSGKLLAGNHAMAYVSDFLPTQKAPFYIDLGQSNYGGIDWGSTVSSISFACYDAFSTTDQQYGVTAQPNNVNGDLRLDIGINGPFYGAYQVIGFVVNDGNKTASGLNVVGTYYNSAETVVAVGYEKLNVSLAPNNDTAFTLSEFDITPGLLAQISSDSVLIQTTTLQGNPQSSAPPTKPLPAADLYLIIGLVVVAIVLVVIVLLVFMKRRASAPPPASPSSSSSSAAPPPEENKAPESM